MKVIGDFARKVREIENVWIPMQDGARLAARVWLPEDGETKPVPAILEYIPYRKRDFTRARDAVAHPYLAGHGYACVRVDLRGSGESDGVLKDEYLQQELDDGVEVIRWIARQPWCVGKVGMMGISWGGFNGLQIAAMQPEPLHAVMTLSSTDDRYADDVHHMGGCLLGDNLSWASVMFAYNACPPDPELAGDRWREMWMERLDGSGHWLDTWLQHQRRDAYWRHGSICEDFAAVKCPVYAVSGWADGYSNAVFRLMANLQVPRKGLIGPWSHKYPHIGVPGPAIGFLQEVVRWFDHWLKGIDSDIMEEPMLRVWMQDSVPPTTSYIVRPGRWVAEPSWPSDNIDERSYPLAANRIELSGEVAEEAELTVQSPLTLGLFAGKWCSYAAGPDLAHDQREEDGGALVFDSERLAEAIEIMGTTVVELEVAADRPVAMVAIRLSDVAEDDKATRVSYGMLNLTHRDSRQHPEALEPGKFYPVRVPLNDVAHVFPKGHRFRISVSSSYWPLAWPPPEPVRLRIRTGGSRVTLPIRPRRDSDEKLRPFGEPEGAPPLRKTVIENGHHNWRVIRDLATDESLLEVINDGGTYRIEDIDLRVTSAGREWYRSVGDAFGSIRGETSWIRVFQRGDWKVETRTRTVLTSTAEHFHLYADLDAFEGDKRVFSRSWDRLIKRDLV